MRFVNFKTEDGSDYLHLYNGQEEHIENKLSDLENYYPVDPVEVSFSSYMYAKFITDAYTVTHGFKAYVESGTQEILS